MIVLTKEIWKLTFESEVGKEGVSILKYCENKAFSEIYIDKVEAFDWIQMLLTKGWKKGE